MEFVIVTKKIILVFFVFIFSCKDEYVVSDLYGSWEGYSKKEKVNIYFLKNKTFELTIQNKAEEKEQLLKGKYYADFTKRPIPMKFYQISEIDYPFHSIIEFVNFNEIKFNYFSINERSRSISFLKDNFFILNKKIITPKMKKGLK